MEGCIVVSHPHIGDLVYLKPALTAVAVSELYTAIYSDAAQNLGQDFSKYHDFGYVQELLAARESESAIALYPCTCQDAVVEECEWCRSVRLGFEELKRTKFLPCTCNPLRQEDANGNVVFCDNCNHNSRMAEVYYGSMRHQTPQNCRCVTRPAVYCRGCQENDVMVQDFMEIIEELHKGFRFDFDVMRMVYMYPQMHYEVLDPDTLICRPAERETVYRPITANDCPAPVPLANPFAVFVGNRPQSRPCPY